MKAVKEGRMFKNKESEITEKDNLWEGKKKRRKINKQKRTMTPV